jgi:gluconate 5-dehydrogenase
MTVREMFELKGRVALITGGSRGLGLQIALGFAEMGAKIAISARKREELMNAQQFLSDRGVDAFTVVNDLSQPEQAQPLAEAVIARFGTIDILVNNAGTSWGAPAEQHPLSAWNKVMTLNATSVFTLCQTVANLCFIPRRAGNIIVVASTAGLRVGGGLCAAAYSASKAAALHLTRALAHEWGPYNIRVNAICPGFFRSKLSAGLLDQIEQEVIAHTPLGRLGTDIDMIGAAVYLASDASRHVTGQHIAIDGGSTAV